MSARTRYFFIAAGLIVVVGLCTGLVAYYNGNLPRGSAVARLPELAYVSADASAVAYADVKDIMASQFRQRLREVMPTGDGKDRLLAETGIDIEHDIDSVLAGMGSAGADPRSALVLFRGRFDTARIEGLATQHGAVSEQYKGKQLLLAPASPDGATGRAAAASAPSAQAIAFLEPGLLAVGGADAIRHAVDAGAGAASLTSNTQLMDYVADAQRSGNAWFVGRFDAISGQPLLPAQLRQQLPPLEWFVLSADIDRGVSGTVRAEARDEQSGEQARAIVNGAVAAARVLAGRDARLDSLLNSLQVSGTGKSMEIAFQLSPEMLDMMKAPTVGQPSPPMH
jgi:hypothetical protein